MLQVKCPHCGWSDKLEEDLMGQVAECPECENDFTLEALSEKTGSQPRKKKPSERVRKSKRGGARSSRSRPEAPAKKKFPILKVTFYAVGAICVVAMLFDGGGSSANPHTRKHLDAVIKQINETQADEPWRKDLMKEVARYYHHKAVDRSPRSNSKKSLHKRVSSADYQSQLTQLMSRDLNAFSRNKALTLEKNRRKIEHTPLKKGRRSIEVFSG